MVKNKTNPIWIVIILAVAFYLYTGSDLFAISLESNQVQYYNAPIEVRFKSDLTNPTITAFYNDVQLFEIIDNESSQDIIFTQGVVNGTYILTISNVTQTGLFKFAATEGNISEIEVIEVRKPFVDLKNDIPNLVDEGTSSKITLKTYTPQGDPLISDAIDVIVYDPGNKEITLTAVKTTANEYEISNFNYADAGNYQFKIRPRKEGFDTREFSAITSVIKSAGIPLIVWIIVGAVVIWIILFIVRRIRR